MLKSLREYLLGAIYTFESPEFIDEYFVPAKFVPPDIMQKYQDRHGEGDFLYDMIYSNDSYEEETGALIYHTADGYHTVDKVDREQIDSVIATAGRDADIRTFANRIATYIQNEFAHGASLESVDGAMIARAINNSHKTL
jgi:hypothetical protein